MLIITTDVTYQINITYLYDSKKDIPYDLQFTTSPDDVPIDRFYSYNGSFDIHMTSLSLMYILDDVITVCSDLICDVEAENATCRQDCPYDGDGICNAGETYYNSRDCYLTAEACSHTTMSKSYPFNAGISTAGDTFGYLINNQQIFRLPGVEHLIQGVDIVTGQAAPQPIFDIQFCDDHNLIQDTYRGFIYQVGMRTHFQVGEFQTDRCHRSPTVFPRIRTHLVLSRPSPRLTPPVNLSHNRCHNRQVNVITSVRVVDDRNDSL